MPEQDQQVDVDRRGYVTITKGDQDAKIVPSSLPVWKDQGWDVKPTEKDEAAPGNEGAPNTDEGTANGLPQTEQEG